MGVVGVLAGVGEDALSLGREHGFGDRAPAQIGDQRHPGGLQQGGGAVGLKLCKHVAG